MKQQSKRRNRAHHAASALVATASYREEEASDTEPTTLAVGVRPFDFGEEVAALAAAQRVGYIRGQVIA